MRSVVFALALIVVSSGAQAQLRLARLGDPEARGFRVIGPSGAVVRRQSLFNPSDGYAMAGHFAGTSLDPLGRIVFAEAIRPSVVPGGPPQSIDAFSLVRVAFDKRERNTLGVIKSPSGTSMVVVVRVGSTPPGAVSPAPLQSPSFAFFTAGDAWALTSDGTIAIVRVADYHVD